MKFVRGFQNFWREIPRVQRLFLIFVSLIGLSTAVLFNVVLNQQERLGLVASDIKTAQVESCHQVGDPLRRAVLHQGDAQIADDKENIEQALEDIADDKRLKPSEFPGIAPDKFRRLLRQGRHASLRAIEQAKERIAETKLHQEKLRSVPTCEARFDQIQVEGA